MTRQPINLSFAASAVLILAMAAAPAMAYTGQELAKHAKISISRGSRTRFARPSRQDHGSGIGKGERRKRAPVFLRYKERGCDPRSWGRRTDWKNFGKQKGRPESRLVDLPNF